jgi:hypothetical protein
MQTISSITTALVSNLSLKSVFLLVHLSVCADKGNDPKTDTVKYNDLYLFLKRDPISKD